MPVSLLSASFSACQDDLTASSIVLLRPRHVQLAVNPDAGAGEPSTRPAHMPNLWASSCWSSTALSRDLLVRITSPAAEVGTLSSLS